MNNIQKLIELIQKKKENAGNGYNPEHKFFNKEFADYYKGASAAFSFCIEKLELLLNTENENGGKNEATNGGKPM